MQSLYVKKFLSMLFLNICYGSVNDTNSVFLASKFDNRQKNVL